MTPVTLYLIVFSHCCVRSVSFFFFFRKKCWRLFLTPYHVPLLLSHVETFETIITGSGFRCFFINTPSWEMIQFDSRICFKWVVKIPPPMKYEVEAPYFCCNESIRCFATCPYLQTSNESNENPGSCKTFHERCFFGKDYDIFSGLSMVFDLQGKWVYLFHAFWWDCF